MLTIANIKWLRPILIATVLAMIIYLYFDTLNLANKLRPYYNAIGRSTTINDTPQIVEPFNPQEFLLGPPTLQLNGKPLKNQLCKAPQHSCNAQD